MEKREAFICALTPWMSEPRLATATAIPGALRAPGCLDWDWGEGRRWTAAPFLRVQVVTAWPACWIGNQVAFVPGTGDRWRAGVIKIILSSTLLVIHFQRCISSCRPVLMGPQVCSRAASKLKPFSPFLWALFPVPTRPAAEARRAVLKQ